MPFPNPEEIRQAAEVAWPYVAIGAAGAVGVAVTIIRERKKTHRGNTQELDPSQVPTGPLNEHSTHPHRRGRRITGGAAQGRGANAGDFNDQITGDPGRPRP